MAIGAVLQIGDNTSGEYFCDMRLVDCNLDLSREYSGFRPDMDVKCQNFSLTVAASGESYLRVVEWYRDSMVVSGRIVFDDYDRTIQFEDARCYSFSERYDIDSQVRRNITLKIEAEGVTVNDVSFDFVK